ncbi:acetyltransferase [Rosistilla oblonga]|uniref:acetyltransferase n=1 Tax=Rosistilla oblonga TaxID=2527990 RepID=UPI003A97300F
MKVREALETERDLLVDIWLRSVRATHDFLSEDDIERILPLVRDHALVDLEIWVLADAVDEPIGFMGLADDKLEALFLAPEHRRRGGGGRMVDHARDLKGRLRVDVNEQNPAALAFYQSLGFVVEGRSELDSAGMPFPILHLRDPAE